MFSSSMFQSRMFQSTAAPSPAHSCTRSPPPLRRDGLSLALAAALTASWAMPAFAQDSAPADADTLDRITVTAQ